MFYSQLSEQDKGYQTRNEIQKLEFCHFHLQVRGFEGQEAV